MPDRQDLNSKDGDVSHAAHVKLGLTTPSRIPNIAESEAGSLKEEALAVLLEAYENTDINDNGNGVACISWNVLYPLALALARDSGYGHYMQWDLNDVIDQIERAVQQERDHARAMEDGAGKDGSSPD